MILAVLFAATNRLASGWAFAAFAVVTKQTALIILPALFLMSIHQKRWKDLFYGFVTFAGIIFLFWMPFFFSGYSINFALGNMGLNPTQLGLNLGSSLGGGGTSIWAFNIWPLITLVINHAPLSIGITGGVKDWLPTQFFGLTYFELGIILFALVYLLILTKIWKESDPQKMMLHFGLLLIAFYMIPVRVHERYLIYGLSFLPFALNNHAFNKQKTILVSYLLLLTTYSLSLAYSLLMGGPSPLNVGIFNPLVNVIFSDIGLLVLVIITVAVFLSLFYFDVKENLIVTKIKQLSRRALRKSNVRDIQ
jgi:hypothetical protein